MRRSKVRICCGTCGILLRCWQHERPSPTVVRASDVMKEWGLLPLPAAPPSGMLGSVQVACERARRPLNGSVCRIAVCGNGSTPTPDGDRPDHRSRSEEHTSEL